MYNPTVYENVINSFKGEKKIKIEAVLNQLKEGADQNINKRIITSLKKERNLPERCMCEILDYLSSDEFERESFLHNYQEICKNYYLKGGLVINSGVNYFGHVVDKSDFTNNVIEVNRVSIFFAYSSQEIDKITQDLQEALDSCTNEDRNNISKVLLEPYEKLVIRKYNMWATWDLTGNDDPFDFLQTRDLSLSPPERGSFCEVRLSLGLCYQKILDGQKSNVLLLTYNATNIKAHIPTIADARGNQYFSPCEEGESHGWTDTTHQDLRDYYIESCLISSSYDSYNDLRRPETVHCPIAFSALLKIEELPIPSIL
jgi:hypothetical protein